MFMKGKRTGCPKHTIIFFNINTVKMKKTNYFAANNTFRYKNRFVFDILTAIPVHSSVWTQWLKVNGEHEGYTWVLKERQSLLPVANSSFCSTGPWKSGGCPTNSINAAKQTTQDWICFMRRSEHAETQPHFSSHRPQFIILHILVETVRLSVPWPAGPFKHVSHLYFQPLKFS